MTPIELAYWLEREGATCQRHIDAAALIRKQHEALEARSDNEPVVYVCADQLEYIAAGGARIEAVAPCSDVAEDGQFVPLYTHTEQTRGEIMLSLNSQIERTDAKCEMWESAMLKTRKALCGDIHNTDNIVDLANALKADAARYRWLRTKSVELSFPNDLIAMLVKDQNELDGSMWAKP